MFFFFVFFFFVCLFVFFVLFCFVLLNAVKIDTNLTVHHMGKIFIIELLKIKFKIWRVTFFNVVYHKEIMGWTSGFPEITEISNTHWFDMNFLETVYITIGGAVARTACKRPRVRSPRPAYSFVETSSWNNFYGHSPSSADSRRADVSYWWKNVH